MLLQTVLSISNIFWPPLLAPTARIICFLCVCVHLLKNHHDLCQVSLGIKRSCFLGKDQPLGFLLSCWVMSSYQSTEPQSQGKVLTPKTQTTKSEKSSNSPHAVPSRNLDLKMASRSHKIQSAPIKNGRVGRNLQLEPL